MRENILEALYNGNIQPYAKQFKRNSAYGRAAEKIADNEERLEVILGKDKFKLLTDILDAQGDMQAIESKEGFVEGFKIGMQIAVSVFFNDREGDTLDITE